MVLVAAAGTALPGWRELAITLIDRPGPLSGDAIQLLGQDASEESLLALRQRLERYAAELEGTVDASVEGQRFFQALIVQVSLFAHPECRRLLNRLARSENEYLSGTAERRILDAGRRSPAFRALEDAHRFRMSGQSDQELQLLDLAVQLDPLLPEAYTRRASARMHAGRFDDALRDLEVASELSPEELEVLSLTALVRIRQGELDDGLRAAEAAIELAPRNWVALYNGACVCARAAELPDLSPDRRLSLADRAIQLLRETAEQGFSDVEHLQKDRDLLPLHGHVMWLEVVQRVTANKGPKIEKPDE
jgi:tetratricopeptide (TPR) repeat protein